MNYVRFIFCLVLVVLGSAQQYTINISQRIYDDVQGNAVVAVAAIGSPSACSGNFFLLSSSGSQCLSIITVNGTVNSTSCPSQLVGATALSCLVGGCYALNPSLKQVVALANNGTVLGTFGSGQLTAPVAISTYQNSSFMEVLVVDSTTAIWQFTISSLFALVSSQTLPVIPAGKIVGIFMSANSSYMIAYSGASQILTYPLFGTVSGTFGPSFGSIQSISQDTYGRVHVYDSSCSCIKILDSRGNYLTVIETGNNTPIYITQRRNNIFVVDSLGIIEYEDEVRITSSMNPITCLGLPGRITAQAIGGDLPFVGYMYPEYVKTNFSGTAASNVTYNISLGYVPAYTLPLFDDYVTRDVSEVVTNIPAANWSFAPNSVFPPQSGNYSLKFTFPASTSGDIFELNCIFGGCMNASQFEYLELWLNVGNGGQNFSMTLTPGYTLFFRPGDLPLNTWIRYYINLPEAIGARNIAGISPYFQAMEFIDLLKTAGQNSIYLDTVWMHPHTFPYPNRILYLFDQCGVAWPSILPFNTTIFQVTTGSNPVSCNAATTTSINLTTNGDAYAVTQYGVPPFSYKWVYSANSSNELFELPALSSYITIYDNSLNSSWVDSSFAPEHNLQDPTYYHSPPYSISFTPTSINDILSFTVPVPINLTFYPTIEFWINGGPTGLQTLDITYQIGATQYPNIGFLAAAGIGVPALPPNTWLKAYSTLTPQGQNIIVSTINFVNFVPGAGQNIAATQPTVYIDDIVLIGPTVLKVTDSTGCIATTPVAAVLAPPKIKQVATIVNSKCYNSSDGTLSLQMTGGTPPFTYQWSVPQGNPNNPVVEHLGESIISVVATDANECDFQTFTTPILQPPPLVLNITTQPIQCYGGSARASAFVLGGIAPYTYTWASSTPPQVIAQPNPSPIFVDAYSTYFSGTNINISCLGTGSQIGSPFILSHSGYCSLFLEFSSATPNASISGCTTCFLTDQYNSIVFWIFTNSSIAIDSIQLVLLQQGAIVSSYISLSSLSSSAFEGKWSKISLPLNIATVNNPDQLMFISTSPAAMGTVILDDIMLIPNEASSIGVGTYPGFTSIVGALAGQYYISIVDGNGCSFGSQLAITQPAELSITYTTTTPTSINSADGTIHTTVQGGTPPYSYFWLVLNQTTPDIVNIPYGPYVVQVTDANGCMYETTAYVDPFGEVQTIKQYNAPLSGGLAAIVGVGTLVCLFSVIMLAAFWASFSKLGSFFSATVSLGCALSYASALVLLPEPTNRLCTLFPWLLGVGFILVYGCLFIKTWALYQVWRKAVHYQKATLTAGYIIKCLTLALVVEVAFLIIWTIIDPNQVKRIQVVDNQYQYQCDTNHPTFWIIFIAAKGAWLLFGAVLSILTRNVVKEYNESSSIAYAIYNNVVLLAIAIPLAVLLKEIPGGRLVVEVVVITMIFSFTMVVMFFRIWHRIILPESLLPPKMEPGSKRTTASSSGAHSKSGSDEKSSSSLSVNAENS